MRNIFLFFIFFVLLAVDQFSKALVPVADRIINSGISFSLFSDVSPYFKIVFISTFYFAILIVSLGLLRLISSKLYFIKLGIVIWLAGATGNVIDRIFWGGAIDFITFYSRWYFNLSDVFQLIAYLILVYSIFVYDKKLWYPQNLRKWTKFSSSDQVWFVLKVAIASTILCVGLGVLSLTYIMYVIKSISSSDIYLFVSVFIAFSLVFIIVIIIFSIVFTKRIAGPVIRFEKYINNLINGEEETFILRDGDYNQRLVSIAIKIKEHLNEKNS